MESVRILVACEESQAVTKEFRKLGIEAFSCDILPCSGGHPEWHIQKDVSEVLTEQWNLVIAHPPCTRICNSGVSWLSKRNLWSELDNAVKFFNIFIEYHKETSVPVMIENPIPHKYAVRHKTHPIGKYDQIIQPWQFGHGETKATCLWLFGLPKLQPTKIVEGREQRLHYLSPGPERAKERSKTYPGIAEAIAKQYSKFVK